MSFVGIITNAGLTAAQLAAQNNGFFIVPTGFGVSNQSGTLDPTRTSPNAGQWYTGMISSRVVIDLNTIEFVCTIPPGQLPPNTQKTVNEVYLYTSSYATGSYNGVNYAALNLGTVGNSITLTFNGSLTNQQVINNWNTANPTNMVRITSGNASGISPSGNLILTNGASNILFAIGETTANTTITYDPTGSVTLDLQVAILNTNLTNLITFAFTEATEIAEHNTDPNAHPDYLEALHIAAIFPKAGAVPFSYDGQSYDQFPNFEGTPASVVYGGITFTAIYNGPNGNSISLTFDGVSTVDEVCSYWNTANPENPVQNSSLSGLEVLPAAVENLSGGTLSVNQWDIVYCDVDGVYKQALADGTIKSQVAGIADLVYNKVISEGFIDKTTGFTAGKTIYLSNTIPGAMTTVTTAVPVGIQIRSSPDLILFSKASSGGAFSTNYTAVVTDTPGAINFPTTQQAIDAVPSGSNILIDKFEEIDSEILTNNKQIDFVFAGPGTGWFKSLGYHEIQEITFSGVPTSGTWRIEFGVEATSDLAYNANALAVQSALNALPNISGAGGLVVTGSYSSGFIATWNNPGAQTLFTFTNPGQDEIQKFSFDAVPTFGSFQIEFFNNAGYTTNPIDSDFTLAQVQMEVDLVLGAGNSIVTGSFSAGFTIEYEGIYGKQSIAAMQAVNNTLVNGVNPVNITYSELQAGIRPASNLFIGPTHVVITNTETQHGTPIGPDTCIQLTEDDCSFTGQGVIQGFVTGIDFNGTKGHFIGEGLYFDPTITYPISTNGKTPQIDYNTSGAIGVPSFDNPELRILQHPSNNNRAVVTSGSMSNIDGTTFSQSQNNQLLDFNGGQIDFQAGIIYAADGVTNVGTFTPATMTSGQYVYYGVSVSQSGVNADNTIDGQLQIVVGVVGSTPSNASKPTLGGGTPVGYVLVEGAGGSNINPVLQAAVTSFAPGSGGGGAAFPLIIQETPAGTVDGTNLVFTTSQIPKDSQSILVMVNRVPVPITTGWSIVGNTITFVNGYQPTPGRPPSVFYISSTVVTSISGFQEVPAGTVNGINDTFTLTGQVPNQESALLIVDRAIVPTTGWELIQGASSSSVKFLTGYIPSTGQTPYIFYLTNVGSIGGGGGGGGITSIVNDGGGIGLFRSLASNIAHFKTLINGTNTIVVDNGDGTVQVNATGGGGSGQYVPQGDESTPEVINPAAGITPTSDLLQSWYIKSATSSGAQQVTANPQIAAGTAVGQRLALTTADGNDFVYFEDGNGLSLNGEWPNHLASPSQILLTTLELEWTGVRWRERNRS